MAEVVIESEFGQGVGWRRIGSVCDVEPPGSFSAEGDGRRDVYIFGWYGVRKKPGVWRSHGGIDVENTAVREIITSRFDLLADLTKGPYEMLRGEQRLRFRLVG